MWMWTTEQMSKTTIYGIHGPLAWQMGAYNGQDTCGAGQIINIHPIAIYWLKLDILLVLKHHIEYISVHDETRVVSSPFCDFIEFEVFLFFSLRSGFQKGSLMFDQKNQVGSAWEIMMPLQFYFPKAKHIMMACFWEDLKFVIIHLPTQPLRWNHDKKICQKAVWYMYLTNQNNIMDSYLDWNIRFS